MASYFFTEYLKQQKMESKPFQKKNVMTKLNSGRFVWYEYHFKR
nr:MAG TPA: hypothetical protein [Caudoviricetes sp.]